jgi:menaquinone-dependent protoporphyrinogen oxidase
MGKVLVTYASKHGSTAEVAKRIAQALSAAGAQADALPVGQVGEVGDYDVVVIGSSVYFGKWMQEAVTFADRNRAKLAGTPVWLFSVGPLGDQPRTEPAEVVKLAALLHSVDHHLFAGELDRSRLSFVERTIVKGVKAPFGDFRDWAEIDSWAAGIASRLATPQRAELGHV